MTEGRGGSEFVGTAKIRVEADASGFAQDLEQKIRAAIGSLPAFEVRIAPHLAGSSGAAGTSELPVQPGDAAPSSITGMAAREGTPAGAAPQGMLLTLNSEHIRGQVQAALLSADFLIRIRPTWMGDGGQPGQAPGGGPGGGPGSGPAGRTSQLPPEVASFFRRMPDIENSIVTLHQQLAEAYESFAPEGTPSFTSIPSTDPGRTPERFMELRNLLGDDMRNWAVAQRTEGGIEFTGPIPSLLERLGVPRQVQDAFYGGSLETLIRPRRQIYGTPEYEMGILKQDPESQMSLDGLLAAIRQQGGSAAREAMTPPSPTREAPVRQPQNTSPLDVSPEVQEVEYRAGPETTTSRREARRRSEEAVQLIRGFDSAEISRVYGVDDSRPTEGRPEIVSTEEELPVDEGRIKKLEAEIALAKRRMRSRRRTYGEVFPDDLRDASTLGSLDVFATTDPRTGAIQPMDPRLERMQQRDLEDRRLIRQNTFLVEQARQRSTTQVSQAEGLVAGADAARGPFSDQLVPLRGNYATAQRQGEPFVPVGREQVPNVTDAPVDAATQAADTTRYIRSVGLARYRVDPRFMTNQNPLVGNVSNIPVDLRPVFNMLSRDAIPWLREEETGKVFQPAPFGETPTDQLLNLEKIMKLSTRQSSFRLPNAPGVRGLVSRVPDKEVVQQFLLDEAAKYLGVTEIADQPTREALLGFLETPEMRNAFTFMSQARASRGLPTRGENGGVGDWVPDGGNLDRYYKAAVAARMELEQRARRNEELDKELLDLDTQITEREEKELPTTRLMSRWNRAAGEYYGNQLRMADLATIARPAYPTTLEEQRRYAEVRAAMDEQSRQRVDRGESISAYPEERIGFVDRQATAAVSYEAVPRMMGRDQRNALLDFFGVPIPEGTGPSANRAARGLAGEVLATRLVNPFRQLLHGPDFEHEQRQDTNREPMTREQLIAEIEDAKRRKFGYTRDDGTFVPPEANADDIEMGLHEGRLREFELRKSRNLPPTVYPLRPESLPESRRRAFRTAAKPYYDQLEMLPDTREGKQLKAAIQKTLDETYTALASMEASIEAAQQEYFTTIENDSRRGAGRSPRRRSTARGPQPPGAEGGRYQTSETMARVRLADSLFRDAIPTTSIQTEEQQRDLAARLLDEGAGRAAAEARSRAGFDAGLKYDPKEGWSNYPVDAEGRSLEAKVKADMEAAGKAAADAYRNAPEQAALKARASQSPINIQQVRTQAQDLVRQVMAAGANTQEEVRTELGSRAGLTREDLNDPAKLRGIQDRVLREALEVLQWRTPDNMYVRRGQELGGQGFLEVSPSTVDRSLEVQSGDDLARISAERLHVTPVGGAMPELSPAAAAERRRMLETPSQPDYELSPSQAPGETPRAVPAATVSPAATAAIDFRIRELQERMARAAEIERKLAASEQNFQPRQRDPRIAGFLAAQSDFVQLPTQIGWLRDAIRPGPWNDPRLHKSDSPSAFAQLDYGPSAPAGTASKVHISATEAEAERTHQIVDAIAREMGITYKFVTEKGALAQYPEGDPRRVTSPKPFAPGGVQQGKFITAYPTAENAQEFTELVAQALEAEGLGKNAAVAEKEVRYDPNLPITHRWNADDTRFAQAGGYSDTNRPTIGARPARVNDETVALRQQLDFVMQGRSAGQMDEDLKGLMAERDAIVAAAAAAGNAGQPPAPPQRGAGQDRMVPGGEVRVIIAGQTHTVAVSMSDGGGAASYADAADRVRGQERMRRAQFRYGTNQGAEDFVQREIDRFRKANKSDDEIRALFRNTGYQNMADVLLGNVGPGGGQGATANARRRQQLGLQPFLGDVTSARAEALDTERTNLMAEAEAADRRILRRGFMASLTDIFQAPFFQEQAASVDKFRREAQQYMKLKDDQLKAGDLVTNLEEQKTEAANRLAAITDASSKKYRKAQERLEVIEKDLADAKDKEAQLGAQAETQKRERVIPAREGLPGIGAGLRNIAIGSVAGGAAMMIASVVYQLSSQMLMGFEQALIQGMAPVIDRATGFVSTMNKVTESLSEATRAASGSTASVARETASRTGMNKELMAYTESTIGHRAALEAGNKALREQIDYLHAIDASRAAEIQGQAGYGTGFMQPMGGIPGITRSTGGPMGSPLFATPSLVEQLTREMPSKRAMDLLREPRNPFENIEAFVGVLLGQESTLEKKMKAVMETANKQLDSLEEAAVRGGGPAGIAFNSAAGEDAIQAFRDAAEDIGFGDDQIKEWIQSGAVPTGPNGAPIDADTLQKWLEAMLRGMPMPSMDTILEGWSGREGKAQLGALQAQTELQLSQLRANFALSQFASPTMTLGDTLFPGGINAGTGMPNFGTSFLGSFKDLSLQGARVPDAVFATYDRLKGVAGDAFAFIEEETQAGSQELKDKFGLSDSDIARVAAIGEKIKQVQLDAAGREMTASFDSYFRTLELSKRALGDLVGLNDKLAVSVEGVGKIEATNVGILQRSVLEKSRSLTVLGENMTQRGINFQKAMAGFSAEGLTPEEIAARQDQAQYEANIKQEMFDIQKSMTRDQWEIVDETNLRALEDSVYDLKSFQQNFQIKIDLKGDAELIESLGKQRDEILGETTTIMGQFRSIQEMQIQTAAQMARVSDEAWSTLLSKAQEKIEAIAEAYRVAQGAGEPQINPYTGFDVGGPGGMSPTISLSPSNYNTSTTTFNAPLVSFDNVTVSKQEDMDELVSRVEMALNRKSALLGLKTPVHL